eukprot:TRINITY_DN2628_c0_g1_i1.p1 TRINITY_DN2628_c0_g1~~TRINITY_DN2628_c0_g1_i1.p1  ORF type:complete len:273 (-),score=102.06 TRINITY_DN2628_c0_g1_i1:780-1598(-)
MEGTEQKTVPEAEKSEEEVKKSSSFADLPAEEKIQMLTLLTLRLSANLKETQEIHKQQVETYRRRVKSLGKEKLREKQNCKVLRAEVELEKEMNLDVIEESLRSRQKPPVYRGDDFLWEIGCSPKALLVESLRRHEEQKEAQKEFDANKDGEGGPVGEEDASMIGVGDEKGGGGEKEDGKDGMKDVRSGGKRSDQVISYRKFSEMVSRGGNETVVLRMKDLEDIFLEWQKETLDVLKERTLECQEQSRHIEFLEREVSALRKVMQENLESKE